VTAGDIIDSFECGVTDGRLGSDQPSLDFALDTVGEPAAGARQIAGDRALGIALPGMDHGAIETPQDAGLRLRSDGCVRDWNSVAGQ
jgi:hypothetical protein